VLNNSELYVIAVCQPPEFGGELEMQDFVSRTQSYFNQMMRNLKKQYPELKKRPNSMWQWAIQPNKYFVMRMRTVSIISWSGTAAKRCFLAGCSDPLPASR
jgi:23S rRNA A1618 N6-methylase RlmF